MSVLYQSQVRLPCVPAIYKLCTILITILLQLTDKVKKQLFQRLIKHEAMKTWQEVEV
jgi:hypothetical protein